MSLWKSTRKRITVVFRGTNQLNDVFTDLQLWQSKALAPEKIRPVHEHVSLHNGFRNYLELFESQEDEEKASLNTDELTENQSVCRRIIGILGELYADGGENFKDYQLFVTGHSLVSF